QTTSPKSSQTPPKQNKKTTEGVAIKKKKDSSPPPSNLSQEQQQDIEKALAGIDQTLEDRKQQAEGRESGQDSSIPSALGSPEGDLRARDPGYVAYQSRVRSHIIRNWVRTHGQSNKTHLKARLQVKIDKQGQIVSKNFVKKSGDVSFDNSTLRALSKASPLPAPPESLAAEALREGLIVDFTDRVLGN
ncbi:MAG: TonB family protein, partial [Deltaproteobacteria bacterium]|nr:TonB family protein [Deltaproteobacteria bacterium]